jgi:transcription elongation factor Elf1
MIDHTNRLRVTCPYCGHEVLSSCDKPDAGNIDCSNCGRNYSYEREHIVTYTSYTFDDVLVLEGFEKKGASDEEP